MINCIGHIAACRLICNTDRMGRGSNHNGFFVWMNCSVQYSSHTRISIVKIIGREIIAGLSAAEAIIAVTNVAISFPPASIEISL